MTRNPSNRIYAVPPNRVNREVEEFHEAFPNNNALRQREILTQYFNSEEGKITSLHCIYLFGLMAQAILRHFGLK